MTMPPSAEGSAPGDEEGFIAGHESESGESMPPIVRAATGPVGGFEERPEPAPRRAESTSSAPLLTGDALAAEGKRWTEQLLSAMGFEATVRASAEGDRVNVTVTVENDEQLLGGDRGEVREAMQQILNRMINRGGDGSRYYLRLEINDFWEKRETDLKHLAERLAAEALEKNAEVATDYLNAQERRIIHMTLREDARVKTYSLGIGHIKRLAVAPADHPGGGAVSEG